MLEALFTDELNITDLVKNNYVRHSSLHIHIHIVWIKDRLVSFRCFRPFRLFIRVCFTFSVFQKSFPLLDFPVLVFSWIILIIWILFLVPVLAPKAESNQNLLGAGADSRLSRPSHPLFLDSDLDVILLIACGGCEDCDGWNKPTWLCSSEATWGLGPRPRPHPPPWPP